MALVCSADFQLWDAYLIFRGGCQVIICKCLIHQQNIPLGLSVDRNKEFPCDLITACVQFYSYNYRQPHRTLPITMGKNNQFLVFSRISLRGHNHIYIISSGGIIHTASSTSIAHQKTLRPHSSKGSIKRLIASLPISSMSIGDGKSACPFHAYQVSSSLCIRWKRSIRGWGVPSKVSRKEGPPLSPSAKTWNCLASRCFADAHAGSMGTALLGPVQLMIISKRLAKR